MHKSEIKKFAVWARQQLRSQIERQAARYGLRPAGLQPAESLSPERLVLGGTVYGPAEAQGYRALERRYQQLLALHGKAALATEQLIDEAAYSWFNRLCALRLLEVNGYLPRRVLSSAEADDSKAEPDLLREAVAIALEGSLPGITPELVDSLRHRDDAALYRQLLVAQCQALKSEYPSLFGPIADELALLLPENLLLPDSLIRRLCSEIPESDWQQVEIIGWLYQYYISERKDAVIGAKKPVASADIPAATQLFTPNWIVQYMVQNSLGKLWLESHPHSPLKAQMPYYLDTPPQSPEVQARLDALKRPALSPEDFKVIDPACGSGHILVYAFDLLFEIYREQGYRERDIPALIFEHNLVGLDLDQRATQLAGFALLVKARQKLRQLKGLQPRVLQVQSSRGIDLSDAETLGGLSAAELAPWQSLIDGFKDADTLGSLLTPPPLDYKALRAQLQTWQQAPNAFVQSLAEQLAPLLAQAELLGQTYDVVVANPPYMGSKGFNPTLKAFAQKVFPDAKSDLFAMFMQHGLKWLTPHGLMGTINQHAWMFLSSYEKLRHDLAENYTLTSMLHLGPRAFPEIGGEVVQSTAFITRQQVSPAEKGVFVRLTDYNSSEDKRTALLSGQHRYQAAAQDFEKIPGAPVAYWVSERVREIYYQSIQISDKAISASQNVTGNNNRFTRMSWEVNLGHLLKKWRPYAKGGGFRKWYGNLNTVVDWSDLAISIYKEYYASQVIPENYWYKEGVTWGLITSSYPSFRFLPKIATFDKGGSSIFFHSIEDMYSILSFLNTKITEMLLNTFNPTLNYQVKDIFDLPFKANIPTETTKPSDFAKSLISLSKSDWDSFETSWDFETHPMVRLGAGQPLAAAYAAWEAEAEARFKALQRLEVENNRYWIDAYGLQDELTPDVPDEQVTVRRAEPERDARSLLSYALGCIMGRYSLDQPGLVHAGQAFDPTKHSTFAADADGIVPVNDRAWFPDDLVLQLMQWLKTVFGEAHYSANLVWLAGVLGAKGNESPEQTLRRYFVGQFMKDHHQTYKKRPIYWFFTSGKKRAFNAYVYLHRYDIDTLARLRTDYLHPLQLKLEAERQRLADDPAQAKRRKALDDQLAEIQAYDEVLKHKADMRLPLNLDDGVAYNYTLFEGLVYEGPDLKMADLKTKSQWKHDLLAEQAQKGNV